LWGRRQGHSLENVVGAGNEFVRFKTAFQETRKDFTGTPVLGGQWMSSSVNADCRVL
jgi:hypothetical protein